MIVILVNAKIISVCMYDLCDIKSLPVSVPLQYKEAGFCLDFVRKLRKKLPRTYFFFVFIIKQNVYTN